MFDRRDAIVLLAGLSLAPAQRAVAADALPDQPPLPKPLPYLAPTPLNDAAGQPTTLGRLLAPNRPTIVSFWATWCAPCAQEGAHLAKLRARYPEDRLAIVGINIDNAPDAARMAAFRKKASMTYLQATDGVAVYGAFTDKSKVALPRSYVFDAKGRPVAAFGRYFGNRTLKAIDAAVAKAVS